MYTRMQLLCCRCTGIVENGTISRVLDFWRREVYSTLHLSCVRNHLYGGLRREYSVVLVGRGMEGAGLTRFIGSGCTTAVQY